MMKYLPLFAFLALAACGDPEPRPEPQPDPDLVIIEEDCGGDTGVVCK